MSWCALAAACMCLEEPAGNDEARRGLEGRAALTVSSLFSVFSSIFDDGF